MNDADFADLDAWKWGLAVIALIYGFIWLGLWRRARLRELEEQGPFARLLMTRGKPTMPCAQQASSSRPHFSSWRLCDLATVRKPLKLRIWASILPL